MLKTGVLIVALLAVLLAESSDQSKPAKTRAHDALWQKLLSYLDRDFGRPGTNWSDFNATVDALLPPSEDRFFRPCTFSSIRRDEDSLHYILVQEFPLFMIPGEAKLRISVFDENGNLLFSKAFSTGWRVYLKGASS